MLYGIRFVHTHYGISYISWCDQITIQTDVSVIMGNLQVIILCICLFMHLWTCHYSVICCFASSCYLSIWCLHIICQILKFWSLTYMLFLTSNTISGWAMTILTSVDITQLMYTCTCIHIIEKNLTEMEVIRSIYFTWLFSVPSYIRCMIKGCCNKMMHVTLQERGGWIMHISTTIGVSTSNWFHHGRDKIFPSQKSH